MVPIIHIMEHENYLLEREKYISYFLQAELHFKAHDLIKYPDSGTR